MNNEETKWKQSLLSWEKAFRNLEEALTRKKNFRNWKKQE